MGMVTEHGRDGLLRWWPLAVVVVVLLLLGIGARRQPSEAPTTCYVSRSRIFWLGRTLRLVRSPRRRHGRVVVTTKR